MSKPETKTKTKSRSKPLAPQSLDLLLSLYQIHSPSGLEDDMANFITSRLKGLHVPFQVCSHTGAIYKLDHRHTPILSAHMDQVQQLPATHITVNLPLIRSKTGLGADDKNGIWVALQMLERNPDLNFIFTRCEEVGGTIPQFLDHHPLPESIPYVIVLDRKGSGDIIGVDNFYCDSDLEAEISRVGKDFGYTPALGVWSDADALSRVLPCVNLSVGYYLAHTENEYTDTDDLQNCLEFVDALISTVPRCLYNQAPEPEHWYQYPDSDPQHPPYDQEICPECRGFDIFLNDDNEALCGSCYTRF